MTNVSVHFRTPNRLNGLLSLDLWAQKFPEISNGKFPEIYSNLPEISGKFLKKSFTYVNQLSPSPALQSDAVK